MRVDCKIRTLGDFRRFTKELDDDFKLDIEMVRYIPEEKRNEIYPYPHEYIKAELEFEDIGYSDKLFCVGVYEKEEEKWRD